MSPAKLLLGIDGGGSKTVAFIASIDESNKPSILGKGLSGPSNIRAIGIEEATRNLENAMDLAFADAGIPQQTFESACFGMAGADRPSEIDMLQNWVADAQISKRIQIVNDALPVLYSICTKGTGIALICGTGSFAFGQDPNGQTARSGGWGHLLGDEGSGYWIALEGLKRAVQFADGRGANTILLNLFLNHFEITESQELIPILYSDSIDRRDIAQLSKIVFDAAKQQDEVAIGILEQAGRELVRLIESVDSKLSLSNPTRIGTVGGVILNSPSLWDLISAQLEHQNPGRFKLEAVDEPAIGAIQIAFNSL